MGYLSAEDEWLWVFDPGKDLRTGQAFQPVGYMGPAFLAFALGKNRVFHIQRSDPACGRG